MLKKLISLVILAGIAFGLQVSVTDSAAFESGKSLSISILVFNEKSGNEPLVAFSVVSNLPNLPSFSEQAFNLSAYQQKNISLILNGANTPAGRYSLILSAISSSGTFSWTMNIDIYSPVRIESVYAGMAVNQGASETLIFIVENQGNFKRNFVIDPNSFPEDYRAVYPQPFDLSAGQSAEVEIDIAIPLTILGKQTLTARVVSGEFSDSADVVLDIQKGQAQPVVEILNYSLSAFERRGYSLTFIISARQDFENLKIAGLPLSWAVLGNGFSISAGETKNATISIIPETFDEGIFDVVVADGSKALASTLVTFSGSRIGITGNVFLGSSSTVGLLFAVIIVLVLLYVRQKNIFSDLLEEGKTFDYFAKLMDKAKDELGLGSPSKNGPKEKGQESVGGAGLEGAVKLDEPEEMSDAVKKIKKIIADDSVKAKAKEESSGIKKGMSFAELLKKSREAKKEKRPERQ